MRVIVSPPAERDLGRLSSGVAQRVIGALRPLREDPRPPGCKLLRDQRAQTWRLRVGDWRILYDIDDAAHVVTILRILHRSKAY
jgi:mRNA interferase RelE/StbE